MTESEGIAKSGEAVKVSIPVPDETDLSNFYTQLNSCKTKPVSLSLIHLFSETFVLKRRNIPTITDLFDKKYLDLEYHDLLEAWSNVNIQITAEQLKRGNSLRKIPEINRKVLVSIVTELVELGHQLVKQLLTPIQHSLHSH